MSRRGRRGLSLLEIQVALMLLFVGVIGVVALAPIGMRGVTMSANNTLAVDYAHQLMEVELALPFGHQTLNYPSPLTQALQTAFVATTTYGQWATASYGGYNWFSRKSSNTGHVPNVNPDWWWQYDLKVSVAPENVDMHKIQITVYWTENSGTGRDYTRQYRLVAYSARSN